MEIAATSNSTTPGRIDSFRRSLAMVFDDNLSTYKWHNIADYVIIGMIILSTAEIFLSTFTLSPTVAAITRAVDILTLAFFTVEVSLRIWVAPLLNPAWKGLTGRLRYCTTFYGFIDFISTYPFLLEFCLPFPYNALRVLRAVRVVRLLRITRYTKSFTLLSEAIRNKSRELIVSMQFLIIITFILSLILYFCEHDAQPDVYNDGAVSALWAFTQYLGDPAGFMDTPPITVIGRTIACVIGLLGIAIVAVPAGILGAGFTETIESDQRKTEIRENIEKLRSCFETRLDRPSRLQIVPPYRTFAHLQSRCGLTFDSIIEAANAAHDIRIVNLGATIPLGEEAHDLLAIELFPVNTSYGVKIDRGSRFTVVAPSSFVDDCAGSFFYYLALMGGFNYISREKGSRVPYHSYFLFDEGADFEDIAEYMADVKEFLGREGAWSLTGLAASGSSEPAYEEQIHLCTGMKKGDESVGPLVTDKESFRRLYDSLSHTMADQFDIAIDAGRRHDSTNPRTYVRHSDIPAGGNHIIMRIAWDAILRNPRRIEIAAAIAEAINRDILGNEGNPLVSVLKTKRMGFAEMAQ